jgi:HTH-type transcriptional regulator/antitoxin HigA
MDCYDTAQCPGSCSDCDLWLELNKIETEEEHQKALTEIETLMAADPEPDTVDGDRLNELSNLVQEYERVHYPI